MGSKHDPERILFFVCLPSPYQTKIGREWGGWVGGCSVWVMLSHLLKRSGRLSASNFNTGTIDINVRRPHMLTTHSHSELERTEYHKQLAYAPRWWRRQRWRRQWRPWQHLECALQRLKRGKQTILLKTLSISSALLLNTSKSVTLTEAPAC